MWKERTCIVHIYLPVNCMSSVIFNAPNSTSSSPLPLWFLLLYERVFYENLVIRSTFEGGIDLQTFVLQLWSIANLILENILLVHTRSSWNKYRQIFPNIRHAREFSCLHKYFGNITFAVGAYRWQYVLFFGNLWPFGSYKRIEL